MSAETKAPEVQEVEMVNIEVNGIALKAPKGSMIIEATDKAGIEIPRFCYHPKLTIAANCRMCLVDVEKTPKPVPACATPVMEGMKVYTTSKRSIDAQHGVMEFLLINHPLDCPICDQGGECELQDLAMGYGRSVSRFTERKRVVKDKNVGPLVQTEMTRCIHCTRCVRFLEEIAGTTEMGGSGRGDRLEIGTCVENSIDSELSGNIIDICPVGALTNKPFRFAARAWELMARPSLGAHDGVGSHLFHHVRRGQVLRSVPRENESTNESWLSDRDRYSQAGLYHEDRVREPQVKENGEWKTVSWSEASETVAEILRATDGTDLGVLMSPSASNEEFSLARALTDSLGCGNRDYRLRRVDFGGDTAPRFDVGIADVAKADGVLLLAANPRQEAPIIGHRVRQAWRNGAKVACINPMDWSFHFSTAIKNIAAPHRLAAELAAVASAAADLTSAQVPEALSETLSTAKVEDQHRSMAALLNDSSSAVVMMGELAIAHPQAALLRALAEFLCSACGAGLNILAAGTNATGAHRYGVLPAEGGLDALGMMEQGRKTYLLWGVEPSADVVDPALAAKALGEAENVIAVASFADEALREAATVLLPLAPMAESEGSVLNLEGQAFSFSAATSAVGEARPGWKILRRLGGELDLDGFDQASLEDVRADMTTAESPSQGIIAADLEEAGLYRIGSVPLYSVDSLCRRAAPLQQTAQADNEYVGVNPDDARRLGLADGGMARVHQGGEHIELPVRISSQVPEGGAEVCSATGFSAALGRMIAPIVVEVA